METKNNKPKPDLSIDGLAIIKTLNSKPRLQTLFFLFIYQELSLTELSERLSRSKNTVIYHMKILADQGLIEEFDVPINGSIKPAKHYRINPEFYQKMFIPFENIDNLSHNEILNYSRQIFKWNALLFETIQGFLKELRNFYQTEEKLIKDPQSALDFHRKIRTPRDLIPLSQEGYEIYLQKYKELISQTQQFLENENMTKENLIRPYLAFHTIFPIKKLVEFRKEQNQG